MNSQRMNVLAAIVAVGAFGFGSTAVATRVLEQVEGAYEARLADVVLPASTAGYVIVPPCATCTRLSLGVNAETKYLVERLDVPFAEFAAVAGEIARSGRARRTAVYVYYDLETKRVTRLVLDDLDA